VRRDGGGKLGGDRERGVHRGCRIGPETPADMPGYGEGFRRPRCGSSGEAKGERERTPGAIYRHRRGEEMEGGLIGMKRE
jgi:hypothetical protein